ncbi:hypothetical protein FRB91_000007 [Serendipita sp. 411]|nr:hypothetical protein FRC15_005125 [Serendipita sp. 397]KAG8810355.1 hypothetical protein FRC19_004597 [Serendipita sp. 401]KAG8861764.1 hypothetical protein FRB91_000007 [Serendipita sp. 411]KAG9034460.1 hypothetical protein FS842_003806 [Serendipita sp. 407]
MKLSLAVFLSAVALAVAQGTVTINTPIGPISCLNQAVTFAGGTAPYTMQVQLFGQGSAPALNTYTGISGSPFTWLVEQGPGTSVFLRLRDAGGNVGETGRIDVQPGGPYPCSAATVTGGSTASTPADTGSTPAPGTTQSVPTSPSSSSSPAGNGSSGSGSTTRSTSASASSTPNSAVSLNAAGGAVLGFAGLVAAALA